MSYIGIISAMREEIEALQSALHVEKKMVKGMRTYYQGRLFDKKVILVFSRWGKVASATTATQLINDFNVKEIIFTGVAGGVQPDVFVGDIVIGKDLYQHDMDASPLVKAYEVPLLGKSAFTTDPDKRNQLSRASGQFLQNKHEFLSKEQFINFQIQEPKIHIGDIASGDQFISSSQQSLKILSGLPTVKCVEMEGAAVAQVCFEYKVPFSIIRTISDNANHNAHIDFPKFAKEIASTYALGILQQYLY
ncbi:5'-methylthioadenosine/adenosylhomocysteine nucleosidase [Lutimonas sp.]|uniref:5'-methylthioadenosine/adenosylhomocysteine nucleosidase n=1 Tax=Lutimonas sp. TaxID=1872403 RepID=UPI003C72C175